MYIKLYKNFCTVVGLVGVFFLTDCMGPNLKDTVNTYLEVIAVVVAGLYRNGT